MGRRQEIAEDIVDYLEEVSGGDYRAMMECCYTAIVAMVLMQNKGSWPNAMRDMNYVHDTYVTVEDRKWQLESLDPATATRN